MATFSVNDAINYVNDEEKLKAVLKEGFDPSKKCYYAVIDLKLKFTNLVSKLNQFMLEYPHHHCADIYENLVMFREVNGMFQQYIDLSHGNSFPGSPGAKSTPNRSRQNTFNVSGIAPHSGSQFDGTYNLSRKDGTYNVGARDGTYNVGSRDGTYNVGSRDGTYNVSARDGTYNLTPRGRTFSAGNKTFNKSSYRNIPQITVQNTTDDGSAFVTAFEGLSTQPKTPHRRTFDVVRELQQTVNNMSSQINNTKANATRSINESIRSTRPARRPRLVVSRSKFPRRRMSFTASR